ncbi:hypothetical protein [Hymenobacter swuensis]|uniref:FCP1 homology domain-containing protein n=1 Tax=Hymenobacter swuensis DY53 TaxID=1227739 RepID=W8F060_9BACT|nr:hypothetical protein [Hymenobacter swuensis]AHJ98774.1 hypothetical protein Hsw_3179 [Hymenobacter swuensis DY53]
MRIAFDLDNTLIRNNYPFPLEQPRWPLLARVLGGEGLRQGIVQAASFCRAQDWEVWVYTTSYRSTWHIRRLFWLHGIWLDGVVNQQRHNREVQARCTKHPPTFRIDLLVDDSEGVRLEGERHGFRVVVISPGYLDWVAAVRAAVRPGSVESFGVSQNP